jgi:hypothetical protein
MNESFERAAGWVEVPGEYGISARVLPPTDDVGDKRHDVCGLLPDESILHIDDHEC